MEKPKVQNAALQDVLLEYVKLHDASQGNGGQIFKLKRLQDVSGATYTLTAQRDATDDAPTSINVTSAWPEQLHIDTLVVARHLERNSPRSIRVVGSESSISVLWFLQSGLYLVEPYSHRVQEIISWISKLRFWVLSARLHQSLSVWTHTPSSARTSVHCIHPKLQIVTEPHGDAFEVFIPVAMSSEHLPIQRRMMSALTDHMQPPLSCSIASENEVPQRVHTLPCVTSRAAAPPVLRLSLPRSAGDDSTAVARLLELVILFPELTLLWLVDVNMLVKRSMRTFLEEMRQSLEM